MTELRDVIILFLLIVVLALACLTLVSMTYYFGRQLFDDLISKKNQGHK